MSIDGFFIVTDIFKHSVIILDPEACPHHLFGEFGSRVKQLDHPYFVAVDQSKQIIVTDSGSSSTNLFHFDGKLLRMFSQNDFKLINETFLIIQGLCLDADENRIVICNSTIYILIKSGRLWEASRGNFLPLQDGGLPIAQLRAILCNLNLDSVWAILYTNREDELHSMQKAKKHMTNKYLFENLKKTSIINYNWNTYFSHRCGKSQLLLTLKRPTRKLENEDIKLVD